MSSVRYLTLEQVYFLNEHQIKTYSPGEQRGIKNPNELDSAIHRPQQSAFGEDAYPTIYEKAAALYQSLVLNHCFHNANKRTAWASLYMFLGLNGYKICATPQMAEDFSVDIANEKTPDVPFEVIVSWIREYTIKK